jgi:hypothetical protein
MDFIDFVIYCFGAYGFIIACKKVGDFIYALRHPENTDRGDVKRIVIHPSSVYEKGVKHYFENREISGYAPWFPFIAIKECRECGATGSCLAIAFDKPCPSCGILEHEGVRIGNTALKEITARIEVPEIRPGVFNFAKAKWVKREEYL